MQEHALQMQEHALQMQQQSTILARISEQMTQKGVSNEGETSMNNVEQGESRLAGKKVKLQLFDGEDPVAWITRAEIYFDVQNTSDDMRVKLARLSMEGSTIHWFNLLMETEDDLSWEKLKRSLIARYGGRRLENPFEELSTLKQQGTVEEYVESFELLSSQVGRLPEEQYLGYFMGGLKAPIKRRVRTLNPRNRMDMMRIAKDVESELKDEDDDVIDRRCVKKGGYERLGQKEWAGSQRNRFGSQSKDFTRLSNTGGSSPISKTGSIGSNTHQNSNSSLSSTGRKGDGGQRSGSTDKWRGIRSFHNDEMEERRAKGLCFKCDGKYHPTLHKCPERSLRVLILGEGETMTEEGEIVNLEDVTEESDEDVEVECKLMGVLGSMGESHTMKVEGKIQNVDLLVLIDSGASHNFISPKVTTALGLAITPITARNIKLGDGHKVLTRGLCEGVKMKVGELEIVVDAWVLELGGMDMVLGEYRG
ncbi:enzymatic polyprotein [Trifolium medium]|uniref:Enzymatic polyprotein n=1 Tax=Trifolium medium TaxID=97028 RepID=A0A392LXT5_9FABA|nr:enzymatic polyprotein [Trifolium medium]